VLLAGGTRERGSPAAIAITGPFPGAAIEPVSSLHSDPRAPSGRYAHALRVPFLVEATCRWRAPSHACSPRRFNPIKNRALAVCVAEFAFSDTDADLAVAGYTAAFEDNRAIVRTSSKASKLMN